MSGTRPMRSERVPCKTCKQWNTNKSVSTPLRFRRTTTVTKSLGVRRDVSCMSDPEVDGEGLLQPLVENPNILERLNQIAKNLAFEWAKDNIHVNCVAPGLVDTVLLKQINPLEK
ncbi:Tropinone reductase 1 [Acorus calamus]|uniref:Tropinone reductase 1 n=1 Tax=Acorus calamus TaxID=4465 RepID=A0AAV9CK44_ACOCL|nr:Tropinone reductase 1 [Acorus calamus]